MDRTDGRFRVIYATDVDGDFECPPREDWDEYSTDRCVEAPPGKRIVGVEGAAGNQFCNPNNCAQQALEKSTDSDCHPTYDCCVDLEPGEHEATCTVDYPSGTRTVTIRTNQCKPPERWDGTGGPSGGDRGQPLR